MSHVRAQDHHAAQHPIEKSAIMCVSIIVDEVLDYYKITTTNVLDLRSPKYGPGPWMSASMW